jgi:hypothetical protein
VTVPLTGHRELVASYPPQVSRERYEADPWLRYLVSRGYYEAIPSWPQPYYARTVRGRQLLGSGERYRSYGQPER